MSKLEEILDKCIAVSEMVKNEPQKQELQGIIVLERFISEQTELNENTKKRTVKENKNIKASSLQSAYDQEATYRKKAR